MDQLAKLVAEFLPADVTHYTRQQVLDRMELAYQTGRHSGLSSVVRKTDGDKSTALRKAEAWIDQQGEYPGCRAAADCMLAVIRGALEWTT